MITLLEWIAFFLMCRWAWKAYKTRQERKVVERVLGVGAGITSPHP